MANEMVTLPAAAIADIRRMLIIGLQSLAEIERIGEYVDIAKSHEQVVNDSLVPQHPTGMHEVGEFAQALMWLDFAKPVEG